MGSDISKLTATQSRDVAHRHSKTCSEKGAGFLSTQGVRGRKKKACSQCATAKVPCDQRVPCTRCLQKIAQCIYHEDCQKEIVSGEAIMELHEPPVRDARHMLRFCDGRPSSPFRNIEGRRTSMPFLLNYTDPATNCISAYYRKAQDLEGSLVL